MRPVLWVVAAVALLPLLLRPILGVRVVRVPTPSTGPAILRWEGFVLHLTATLRRSRRNLSGLHVVCRVASRCISAAAIRRLDRQMMVAYTLFVGDVVPPSWLSEPGKLVVLVGLDCRALTNLRVDVQDILVLVASQGAEVERSAFAFETCWRVDLLNVLAVQSHRRQQVGDALQVYTYQPYYPGQCHDMRPRLAAVWTPRSPHRPAAFGIASKDRDFGGCPLRIVMVNARPWTVMAPSNDSSRYRLSGTYAKFMFTIAQHLNFSPVFSETSDGQWYGNPTRFPDFGGILGDVYSNRSDLSLTYSGADIQLLYHVRPSTSQITCTTWCMPTGVAERSIWRPLVDEFTTVTWAAVLASYAVGTVTYRILLRGKTFQDSGLIALQGIVSSIDHVPDSWPPRAFLFCWSFFGMVMATLYMAALNSIHTLDTDDTVFRSLSEIAYSEVPVLAATDYLRGYKQAQWDTPSEQRLMSRVTPFSFDKSLAVYGRFFTKRTYGVLMDRNACNAYANLFTPPRHALVFHTLRGYCLSVSAGYNFIMRQGSPLLSRFAKITTTLDESGLTQFWMLIKPREYSTRAEPVLKFKHLKPFLLLLGIGVGVATMVFILELLWYQCTKFGSRMRRTASNGNHQHQHNMIYNQEYHIHPDEVSEKHQRLLQHIAGVQNGHWESEDATEIRWRAK